MKIPMVLASTLLIVLIQKSELALAEKSCKAVQSEITKKQMQGMPYCVKKLKYKGKEKAKKMNCIIRCVMIKESFLDENGQTSPELFQKYAEIFPVTMRDHFNNTMWPCMESAFDGFKDPINDNDETCASYDSFLKW